MASEPPAPPSYETLITRARALAPILRARAVETEALRRVPDQSIADLRASYAGQMDFGKASGLVKTMLTG